MPISIPLSLSRWALRTAVSGAAASALSSVVVALCSARETGRPSAGVNAASQWIWGARAKHHFGPSWRYTAVGYVIHHASSMLWAGVYEYWCRRSPACGVAGQAGKAAAVAALACTVDYTITPRRFRPGFERHLGRPSIGVVYASFAVGLLVARACRTPCRVTRGVRARMRSVRKPVDAALMRRGGISSLPSTVQDAPWTRSNCSPRITRRFANS